MANYACDFIPHLPIGAGFIPSNGQRPQHGYVTVGGSLPLSCDTWAIIKLEPKPHPGQFEGTSILITNYLEQQRRWTVREISRCGLGAALVRFMDVVERDNAVMHSPYFIGDTIMRVLEQNRGENHRSVTFTHDCWLMLMNYPIESWNLDTIVTSLAQYGRVLIWNKDETNKARILVKMGVLNLDCIHLALWSPNPPHTWAMEILGLAQ